MNMGVSSAFAGLNFQLFFNVVMFFKKGIIWLGKGTVLVYNCIMELLETKNVSFNMEF